MSEGFWPSFFDCGIPILGGGGGQDFSFYLDIKRRLKCTIVTTRCPSSRRLGFPIFDFFSANAEQNLTKVAVNQDVNILYQVFVFWGWPEKTRWPPWPLIDCDTFNFFSETAKRNSMKFDRKQDLNVFYQVWMFRADRKTKMVALVSGWLKYFRLILCNRWTEISETWLEARTQCPPPPHPREGSEYRIES